VRSLHYERAWRDLETGFGRTPDELTHRQIVALMLLDWRDDLEKSELSPVTIRDGYLAATKSFFGWAKRKKRLPRGPSLSATRLPLGATSQPSADQVGGGRSSI
jgi:hypothetical protein